MTREEIIKLARDHGATPYTNRHYPDRPTHTFNPEQLGRFFQAAYDAGAAAAKADEREACAKVWMTTKAKQENGRLNLMSAATLRHASAQGETHERQRR